MPVNGSFLAQSRGEKLVEKTVKSRMQIVQICPKLLTELRLEPIISRPPNTIASVSTLLAELSCGAA